MKKTSIIIIAVVVILGLWVLGTYNSLVTNKTAYTAQWSQVQNQYQRRFDLIPNLVEVAKGAQKQEQEIFTALAEARTRYGGATTPADKIAATNQVESALGRLLVVVENYPALKSNEVLQGLLVGLEGTENRVAVERQKYNDTVRVYNLKIQRFPGSLLASMFGFEIQPYYESTPGSEKAPEVKF